MKKIVFILTLMLVVLIAILILANSHKTSTPPLPKNLNWIHTPNYTYPGAISLTQNTSNLEKDLIGQKWTATVNAGFDQFEQDFYQHMETYTNDSNLWRSTAISGNWALSPLAGDGPFTSINSRIKITGDQFQVIIWQTDSDADRLTEDQPARPTLFTFTVFLSNHIPLASILPGN